MALHRFASCTLLSLLLTPLLITCAAEQQSVDPNDNDAKFEALMQQTIEGKRSDYWAQSRLMNAWNNLLKPINPYRDAPLAPAYLQQWATKAQLAVGVKENQLVPVKKLSPRIIDFASTTSGSININLRETKRRSYGVVNCILHHESSHVKHNDDAMNTLMLSPQKTAALFFMSALISKKIPIPGIRTITYPAAILTAQASGSIHWSQRHRERRADIEGFYATQCHHCVSEYSKFNERIKPEIAEEAPYLPSHECDIIAQRLKKENKTCDFHSNVLSDAQYNYISFLKHN